MARWSKVFVYGEIGDAMSVMDGREAAGMEKIGIELVRRLKESRKNLGLSQLQVASALGVTRVAISMIESGSRKVEAVELGRFAILYGKDIGWLLSDIVEEHDKQRVALQDLIHGLNKNDLLMVERFCKFLRK